VLLFSISVHFQSSGPKDLPDRGGVKEKSVGQCWAMPNLLSNDANILLDNGGGKENRFHGVVWIVMEYIGRPGEVQHETFCFAFALARLRCGNALRPNPFV
jgi:hypothetical protein